MEKGSSEQLLDWLEGLEQKLGQEAKDFELLVAYFEGVQSAVKKYAKGMSISANPLKSKTQASVSDTWGYTLKALVSNTEEHYKAMTRVSDSFSSDLIEPLEAFAAKYSETNKSFAEKNGRLLKLVNVNRGKVEAAKENYKKAMTVMERTNSSDHTLTRSNTQVLSESLSELRASVSNFNEFLVTAESFYTAQLETLRGSEERKVEFLKEHMGMFFKKLEQISRESLEMYGSMKAMLELVKPEKKLVAEAMKLPREQLFGKVSFDDEMNSLRKTTRSISLTTLDVFRLDEPAKKILDTEFVDMMHTELIIEGKPIKKEDKKRLSEIFKSETGRTSFASVFYGNARKKRILGQEAFTDLAEVTIAMLDEFVDNSDKDYSIVWPILNASYHILSQPVDKKASQRLLKLLGGCSLIKDKNRLKVLIEYKLESTSEARGVGKKEEKGLLDLFWSAGSKFLFGETEEEKDESQSKDTVSAINSEMVNIVTYLSVMEVDVKVGIELVVHFAGKYRLGKDKVYLMLSDYESAQRLPRDEDIKENETRAVSLKKRERERKKYGNYLVLGCSVKYLDDCATLRNLLVLSKDVNEKLKRNILKQALLLTSPKKQHQIWKLLAFDQKAYEEYEKIKADKMDSFIHFNEPINHLIDMDVHRSFYAQEETHKQVLALVTLGFEEHSPQLRHLQP